jgi:hypothetical protein
MIDWICSDQAANLGDLLKGIALFGIYIIMSRFFRSYNKNGKK